MVLDEDRVPLVVEVVEGVALGGDGKAGDRIGASSFRISGNAPQGHRD